MAGQFHWTRRSLALGLAGLAAACSPAPHLAAGETGRIARVSDGDLIALDTGQRVRLAELEAPAPGYQDRKGEPFADEARKLLTSAALGRQAKLFYGGLSRDRYDRAIAHVIATDEVGGDVWLNGFMARQGGARVRTYPDNSRRVRELLKLETEARAQKRGLWALDHWRVRALDDLKATPVFAIVEGRLAVLESEGVDSEARLTPQGITLTAGAAMGKPDIKLNTGAAVRVRGRIDAGDAGPYIRLTHWGQVETVEG